MVKPASLLDRTRAPLRVRGQAVAEYLVLCLVLVAVLFMPIPGTGQAAGALLAGKIHDFYTYLTFFLSLP